MRARLVLLLLASAAAGFGQYSWDYTSNPVVSDATRWSTYGSPTYGTYGANFAGSGGSLVSIPAISGVNSSDYEVRSTLSLQSGGGTYIHFLRTSGGTVHAGPGTCSGSYISMELAVPGSFTSPGAATLNVKQCVAGAVSTLSSVAMTATEGMMIRTVVFGGTVWVFNGDNTLVSGTSVPLTTGNPGIGGYNMPTGAGFTSISLGHHDVVSPGSVVGTSTVSSVFPNSVSLRWAGVQDDPVGAGFFFYNIFRSGAFIDNTPCPEFVDNTVAPGTTYTYSVAVYDYHGNYSSRTTITVTTPPANAVDPRRTGIHPTGSYWGGGGEQIDTLSGNVNFSLPLLTAQGRAGWTVPVGLVYNSQNWRYDNGVNWKLGNDVGYGFGWQMLIGSITPYYTSSWSGADHYVYTDSTGAQYVLNVNTGGVWSSQQSAYVWFDSNTDKLHFKDGSFWVMGCTSGGTEADAGSMYPTMIEDVSGNQVNVTYDFGAGLPSTAIDSSARITFIEDSRAVYNYGTSSWWTYRFGYSYLTLSPRDPFPHLGYIINSVGTSEAYNLGYSGSVALGPPFGSDPAYAGLTTRQLIQVTTPTANPWQFAYDTSGAAELLQATFPWGGHLRWTFGSDPYSGSRSLRAVTGRYLAGDSGGATEWSYGISRDNAATSGGAVHATMTLSDASTVGAKTWNFISTSTPLTAWQVGLASEFVQSASYGGTVLKDDVYTWSQDPASNPYISKRTTTIGQGTLNVQAATSTQTLDQYGNVTQSVIYPYNNTTTPLKTFDNVYKLIPAYTANYIFNRLDHSNLTLSTGLVTPSLVVNTYDSPTNCSGSVGSSTPCSGYVAPVSGPTREMDSSPPIPLGQRGYLNQSVTAAKTTTLAVYTYGSAAMVWGSDGSVSSASADASTNFNAPVTITSQSYTTTMAYNSWLGVTQTTGTNGEQMSMTYDVNGRPATATSPYCGLGCTGPTVGYSYGTSIPFTQTKFGPDGVTITTLDGLGRAIQGDRGPSTTAMQSSAKTTYAPCACSPLGKIQQTSQPFVFGSTATASTTYTYDGLGRPVTVVQPDGHSATTYAYSGNVTTVTDPKGNWKEFTTDVEGNLVTVKEPDPCGTNNLTTYTYDWMGHVKGVTMTRSNITYVISPPSCSESGTPNTQTRAFLYDNGGRLTSATNPENGTVSYVYNSDNTLQYKTDAKGQQTVYSYL